MKPIILVGFMGSGKSTIAKELARIYSWPLIEMDAAIEDNMKMSISDIFSEYGEDYFRELETALLQESVNRKAVIATGGGILSKKVNQEILKKQPLVFYLEGSFETLNRNIKQDKVNKRPLAKGNNDVQLKKLLNSRLSTYEDIASYIIPIDNQSVTDIVLKIQQVIKEMV